MRCSRGKKLLKNGPELSWNLFTVLYRLCLLSMKKFWSQNWFGTLQAFIWYHKHWGLIIRNCSRDKYLLKNGPELGWNMFTVLCRLFFCLCKNFFNQKWWGTLKVLFWDHENWGLIILSCSKKGWKWAENFNLALFFSLFCF